MHKGRLFTLGVIVIAIGFMAYLVALRLHPRLNSNMLQYQDPVNGVVFEYSQDLSLEQGNAKLTTEWQSYSDTTRGQLIARVTIPKESQPNTNFGDARWQIGSSKDPKALASCTSPAGYTKQDTRTISSIPFSVLTTNGAGAGNFYETTSYRAKIGDRCIVIEYIIHSVNIQNFPQEYGIKEFNKAKVVDELESITRSLHLLTPQS